MTPERLATITSPQSLERCQIGRDVHLHGAPERVQVLVLDRHGVADAGVVDEHIDRARLGHGLGDQPLALLGDGDVGRHDDRAREVGGQRLQPLGPPCRQHHGGAGGVEHPGEAVTETGRRAGDDGHAVLEPEGGERVENVSHGRRD